MSILGVPLVMSCTQRYNDIIRFQDVSIASTYAEYIGYIYICKTEMK